MTHLLEKWVCLCLVLTAGNACLGVELAVQEQGSFRPEEWTAASEQQLDDLRGGFEAASGLMVSFGIVRTVSINGDFVHRTSFNLPDVGKITAEQARMANAAMGEAALVQNGAGNMVDAGVQSQLEAGTLTGTLIQNSLNDQKLQTLTIINTGVNSLGLWKSINSQRVLNDALLDTTKVH